MGRPKKKTESELMTPDEEMPPVKPITKMVDAEHTIKYREPVPVPVPESEEEATIWEDEDETQQRRKPQKSVREKIQERLGKAKVGNSDQLWLRIDRMPNYDPATGSVDGMAGEKEFCWRGGCTLEYITNDDYLADTGKRHGAGVYWFTLRHGKIIVAAWQHRIGGNPQVATQTVDSSTGQPQVVYQSVSAQPQQNGIVQPSIPVTKTLKEVAEIIEVVDRIRGNPEPVQYQQPPTETPLSPKAALLNAMAEHPDVVEAITDKLMGGSKNGNREPSLTELLIKHGADLANAFGNMVQGVVRTVASEFKEIRSIQNQNYEQNEMGTQTQTQGEIRNRENQTIPTDPQRNETLGIPQLPETTSINASNGNNQSGQSPEEALLTLVCDNCARNIPPKITAQRIDEFAIYINENFPHLSIDGWIEMFCETEVDSIISLASQGAFGEQGRTLASASHAREWIGGLQGILRQTENMQEGDDH